MLFRFLDFAIFGTNSAMLLRRTIVFFLLIGRILGLTMDIFGVVKNCFLLICDKEYCDAY